MIIIIIIIIYSLLTYFTFYLKLPVILLYLELSQV